MKTAVYTKELTSNKIGMPFLNVSALCQFKPQIPTGEPKKVKENFLLPYMLATRSIIFNTHTKSRKYGLGCSSVVEHCLACSKPLF
jgi:hypothetical protein